MDLLLSLPFGFVSHRFEFVCDARLLDREPVPHLGSASPDFLNYLEMVLLHTNFLNRLISFFPFFLRDVVPNSEVYCVDDLFETPLQVMVELEHHSEGCPRKF